MATRTPVMMDRHTGAAAGTWPPNPPTLRPLELPPRLWIPLPAPAEGAEPPSLRPAGSEVAGGEALADVGDGPVPLAPAAGRIIGLAQTVVDGHEMPAIEFEPHALQPPRQSADTSPQDPWSLGDEDDLATWIERFARAGITARRTTCPDLLGQLRLALRRPVDTILCNLLDEDPEMRLNSGLGARAGIDVAAGVALLARLTGAGRRWAVTEAGSPFRWWRSLRPAARQAGVQLIALRNDYPLSDPTLLLYTLQDRRLRPDRLPAEQGVLMIDAAAAAAIGRLAGRGRPMLQVPLAVHDHIHQRSHYLLAAVGMSFRQILDQIEIPAAGRILRLGAMLRDRQTPPDAVVAGGELTLHVSPEELAVNPQPCIRCSWCVQACPTRIHPAGLLEAAQAEDPALADHYGLEACIECGICSYVCPSRLPLLGAIRKLKQ